MADSIKNGPTSAPKKPARAHKDAAPGDQKLTDEQLDRVSGGRKPAPAQPIPIPYPNKSDA